MVLITVSIKVRKEVVDLADKMVRLGLARSRSHAFNMMIEKGLDKIREEVGFWEDTLTRLEDLSRSGYRVRHGGLSSLLEEGRSR